MEINKFEEVIGVVTTAEIIEGRFVLLTSHAETHDFGSQEDLPAAKIPATADEAKAARFVVTWPVTTQKPPFYTPTPAFDWTTRGGFGSAANVPFTASIALTYPGHQHSQAIPSGSLALAFGVGTYTIPSGQYIYNANLIKPGAFVIVANTAEDTTDAGKPKYQATFDDRVVGVVHSYDSSNGDLVIVVK